MVAQFLGKGKAVVNALEEGWEVGRRGLRFGILLCLTLVIDAAVTLPLAALKPERLSLSSQIPQKTSNMT